MKNATWLIVALCGVVTGSACSSSSSGASDTGVASPDASRSDSAPRDTGVDSTVGDTTAGDTKVGDTTAGDTTVAKDVLASGTMSFFVTSVGNGANGGNYGGLAGADARCQSLATAVGAGGKTWHAYLSTDSVNARDRIGSGPWYNYQGSLVAASVASLHANGFASALALTETGTKVPSDDHDIVTGTQTDGTAFSSFPGNPGAPPPTCQNWTSSDGNDYVYVGHVDWDNPNGGTWNSAHETTCSQSGLKSTAGSGRLYCFAS
jgi:hypothetical protein